MTSSRFAKLKSLPMIAALLVGAATTPLAGCAGQGDVDRTQPDKVQKSIFLNADGTPKIFYFRQTYVGVPSTSNWAFEGTQGAMEKVRFEIKEKFLVAYRAYDYAPGASNDFTSTGNNTDAPILMYAIKSHFDVKREYNPGTGEQTNVISENTTDRPWDQRQYMRVDWSSNLTEGKVTQALWDPMFGFMTVADVAQASVQETSMSDPSFKDRPIMTGDYIEFLQHDTKSPDLGACSIMYPPIDDGGPWNCGPAQVDVRNSFLAVKTSTYEPLDYPDNYTINDDNFLYVFAAKGAKAGGSNGATIFLPETVWDYEAGWKTQLLDKHVRVQIDDLYND